MQVIPFWEISKVFQSNSDLSTCNFQFAKEISYCKLTAIYYIKFQDREILLVGAGDTNGKPQISKTNHLKEAYEFGKTIFQEWDRKRYTE